MTHRNGTSGIQIFQIPRVSSNFSHLTPVHHVPSGRIASAARICLVAPAYEAEILSEIFQYFPHEWRITEAIDEYLDTRNLREECAFIHDAEAHSAASAGHLMAAHGHDCCKP